MTATFLLPVYNGARTLRQAVDSVLRQHDPDFELLLIDDASTDGSSDIVRSYGRQHSRVTAVVHGRNQGLSATLNEGLERARHELVARMDQDDESLPERLHVQRAFMEDHPEVAVAGSWVRHMATSPELDRIVQLPTDHDAIAATLVRENCIYHPSVMMRRTAVLELGGYRAEFKNAEDYDLWFRVARAHELANVPRPLLRYRFSVDGMTLGRKWEQLYYIHLAQASAHDPEKPFEHAERRARESLAALDRRWFLLQVAQGTVRELIALRHWRDAIVVAGRFVGEIGVRPSASLLREIAGARIRQRHAA